MCIRDSSTTIKTDGELTREKELQKATFGVLKMEEIKDSSILRPYYDPETFNVGYSAVFQNDKGVIDQNGLNIASKLTIVNQSVGSGLKSLNRSLSGCLLYTSRCV